MRMRFRFRWLVALCCLSLACLTAPALASTSVRAFGAKGDGTTNDSAAFVAALASGEHTVTVPAGTYLIGPETITIPAGVTLVGEGRASALKLAPETGCIFNLKDDARLRELLIDGSAAKQQGGPSDAVVASPSAKRARFENLTFVNCDRACIFLDHGDGTVVSHCTFEQVAWGVSATFSSRLRIQDNAVYHARAHGIQFWGNADWQRKESTDVICTGNAVYDVGGGGIWGTGMKRVVFANNIIDGAGDVGLDLEWCEDGVISNNTAMNCENGGVSLFFSCERITISGNTIYNNRPIADPKAGWYVRSGIWLTYPNHDTFTNDNGHRDITITGNTIVCAPDGPRRAMWIGSGSKNVVIANNAITGGAIWKGGVHQHNEIPLVKVKKQNVTINE